MITRRALIASVPLVLAISACTTAPSDTTIPSSSRTSAAHTSATAPSTTPSATPSTIIARGLKGSTVPPWAGSPTLQVAARFVLVASTPDARLDPTPIHAWRRAASEKVVCAPALAHQIQTQRDGGAGQWWHDTMLPNDGWVSITITNILGDEPQATGDPTTPQSKGPVAIDVIFTRDYHTTHGIQHDKQLHTWTLTVTDGKVTDFTPDGN